MALKVLHLSTYDANGGAARAAYSLHRALLANGVESRMRVAVKNTTDPTVVQGSIRKFRASSLLDRQLWRTQRSPRTTWRSPARFSSISAKEINASNADIVNLHWVTDGFISIEEIGKIEIPIVWSMYDMWPFSGTEHYGGFESNRWRDGYTRENRPADELGFDLDRWAFERKVKSWSSRRVQFHMIPASRWLEDATRQSSLMAGWPTTRIPHVVDTDVFAPRSQSLARSRLNLPSDVPVVLFLASAGISDRRKGWDLLAPSLARVSDKFSDLHVIVAGPDPDAVTKQAAIEASKASIHWRGSVTTDEDLRELYAAADLVAVPSREDNMPLTAMEALATGCPVVGFKIGGMIDVISRTQLSYLAKPYDADDLAKGITSILAAKMYGQTREYAESLWSPAQVSEQYISTYEQT